MFYNARWYDPYLNRWIQPDTIVPDALNPQALDRYAYTLNNPVRYTDPSGHCSATLPHHDPSFGADCVVDFLSAVQVYQAGDRDPVRLAARATGFTRWVNEMSVRVDAMNADLDLVFSNAPLANRALPSARVGLFAAGTAASVVGAAQMAGPLARAAATARLQAITNGVNAELAAAPNIARGVLSPAQYANAQYSLRLARMEYGNALERLTAQRIRQSSLDRLIFKYVGGPWKPDFVGRGLLQGANFDITTAGQAAEHLTRRGYGVGLNTIIYSRPEKFGLFP